MKAALCLLAVPGLLALGCRAPWDPRHGVVVGTVRYGDRTPVYVAKVQVVGGPSTYTDMFGGYRLRLAAPADTITIVAQDGHTPGVRCAETSWGSARVVMRRSVVIQDIVLDHQDPI